MNGLWFSFMIDLIRVRDLALVLKYNNENNIERF
jgi:hypothetical protein